VIQRTPTLFRPPHGQVTGALLRTAAELGMTTVLWSVDRLVPGIGTPAAVGDAMSTTIQAGDIVCLHDGLGHSGYRPRSAAAGALRRRREVEIAALAAVFSALRSRGLHVGSVGDLQMVMLATHPNAAG
jgi:peptidoglycan-N-acetylglucosamine deacetylase